MPHAGGDIPAATAHRRAPARAAVARPRKKGPGRLNIAARIAAAIPGNYALTSILTGCLARLLPASPAEASAGATLISFALFSLIALAAFAVRSVGRLWLVMAAAALVAGGGLWLSIATGGRL